jgi:hypothetical protein
MVRSERRNVSHAWIYKNKMAANFSVLLYDIINKSTTKITNEVAQGIHNSITSTVSNQNVQIVGGVNAEIGKGCKITLYQNITFHSSRIIEMRGQIASQLSSDINKALQIKKEELVKQENKGISVGQFNAAFSYTNTKNITEEMMDTSINNSIENITSDNSVTQSQQIVEFAKCYGEVDFAQHIKTSFYANIITDNLYQTFVRNDATLLMLQDVKTELAQSNTGVDITGFAIIAGLVLLLLGLLYGLKSAITNPNTIKVVLMIMGLILLSVGIIFVVNRFTETDEKKEEKDPLQ